MCRAMVENGRFDPALCPLLDGLMPEEIIERLESDPNIRACAKAVEDPELDVKEALSKCAESLRRANAVRHAANAAT